MLKSKKLEATIRAILEADEQQVNTQAQAQTQSNSEAPQQTTPQTAQQGQVTPQAQAQAEQTLEKELDMTLKGTFTNLSAFKQRCNKIFASNDAYETLRARIPVKEMGGSSYDLIKNVMEGTFSEDKARKILASIANRDLKNKKMVQAIVQHCMHNITGVTKDNMNKLGLAMQHVSNKINTFKQNMGIGQNQSQPNKQPATPAPAPQQTQNVNTAETQNVNTAEAQNQAAMQSQVK